MTQRNKILLKNNNNTKKTAFYYKELTDKIIACAIEVHRNLGPGLLESTYEECFCYELKQKNISFERQKSLPLEYKRVKLDCSYRIDLMVDNKIIIEIKTTEKILSIHEAQLLTYLKLSKTKIGLIINFNVDLLKNGIKRLIL